MAANSEFIDSILFCRIEAFAFASEKRVSSSPDGMNRQANEVMKTTLTDKILILFGSETGTAQDVAQSLFTDIIVQDTSEVFMSSMDEYMAEELNPKNFFIFICSTTGQGDEPTNMRKFWKSLLRKSLANNFLKGLRYILLGLGDSTYSKYNYAAKKLHNRLKQLSATALMEPVYVDEQYPQGPEFQIDQWMKRVKLLLRNYFGIKFGPSSFQDFLFPYIEIKAANVKEEFVKCQILHNDRVTPLNFFQNVRNIEITYPFSHNIFQPQPFDIVSILPRNRETVVQSFIKLYNIDDNFPHFSKYIKNPSQKHNNNSNVCENFSNINNWKDNIRDMLYCIDLQAVPRRSFFRRLLYYARLSVRICQYLKEHKLSSTAQIDTNSATNENLDEVIANISIIVESFFAHIDKHGLDIALDDTKTLFETFEQSELSITLTDNVSSASLLETYTQKIGMEHDRLSELCCTNVDSLEELYSYSSRVRRTILETFCDFPATAKIIPLSHVVHRVVPCIQPRDFSIAQCQTIPILNEQKGDHIKNISNTKLKIQILMAVVEYKTKLKIPRLGTCSYWLSEYPEHSYIDVRLKKGFVYVPSEPYPFIMVGPGTGVAPLHFLIHYRIQHGIKHNFLFFGCRNMDKDEYFKKEFEQYVSDGYLQMFTAYSRDQKNKIYVQDLIRQQCETLGQLIVNENAFIFISGRSKQMPDQVLDALEFCIAPYLKASMEQNDPKAYIQQLLKRKRIQMETWS